MFPFLIIGGLVLGGIGVGAKIDAASLRNKAEEQLKEAQGEFEKAQKKFEETKEELSHALRYLHKNLSQISRLLDFNLSSIANQIRTSNGAFNLKEFGIVDELANILIGGFYGAGSSALAYIGAVTFGKASTGTAISALSGAAQHKAAMAFLGGGAKTVGGFGMAGGTVALSILGLGVGILIWGIGSSIEASEYYEKVQENIKKIHEARIQLIKVTGELNITINKLQIINKFNTKIINLLTTKVKRANVNILKDFYIDLLTKKISQYLTDKYSIYALENELHGVYSEFEMSCHDNK